MSKVQALLQSRIWFLIETSVWLTVGLRGVGLAVVHSDEYWTMLGYATGAVVAFCFALENVDSRYNKKTSSK